MQPSAETVRGGIDPARYVVKVTLASGVVGLAFFALAVFFTWWMFAPFVPDAIMRPWLLLTGLVLVVWLVLDIILYWRHPDDRELIEVWSRVALGLRVATNIVVLSTIWLFLPYAPRTLQLVMTVFYAAHVPTQVLTQPGNVWVNGTGAVAVLASVIAVNLIYGGDYSGILAGFLAAFALSMIALSRVVGRLLTAAVQARQESDRTAAQLETALEAVSAERDAKTRFIAAASHDLGQPLQAASLFFDQVMRASDEGGRAKAAEGVRRAFASAEQLLSHMLNHLRLEADRIEPLNTRVSIGRLLQRVANQFAPAASRAGIELRHVTTRQVVLADPSLLERALGNLAANAIQHSGGSKVLVGLRRQGSLLRIWVIDNGAGIGRADAQHVFNDYFKGSDSRDATRSGFGLGLASARRIAALLHGSAGLDERWRRGAAFWIELPDPGIAQRSGSVRRKARERREVPA